MLTTEKINELIGVDDSWKAPDRLMTALLNHDQREKLFMAFLKENHDLSFDWFRNYFESEAADRKGKKQDFTPSGVTDLVSKLTGVGQMVIDSAAGTGGITIAKWWDAQQKVLPWDYHPSDYIYWAEELSDRAIPFLLFNCAIRGMNAVIIHIDLLSRQECKGVYFIQNETDFFLGFSHINVLPPTDQVAKYFNVKSWSSDVAKTHIEDTEWPDYLTRRGAVYTDGKEK